MVPNNLDMRKYLSPEFEVDKEFSQYELFSVISSDGETMADSKCTVAVLTQEDSWIEFDRMSRIELKKPLNETHIAFYKLIR